MLHTSAPVLALAALFEVPWSLWKRQCEYKLKLQIQTST
jgi:hypothetical protein